MISDPILLVDDEADLRIPLRDALLEEGYNVEDADCADKALALIDRQHYPVILTDLHMPGGPSGLDLIAAVKARDPKALCIVVTGYATLGVAIDALKCGAYDFIQKPFKLAEIQAVLDRALDHACLSRQILEYQEDLESLVVERVKELQTLHGQVLELNALMIASHGDREESAIFQRFLAYQEGRIHPDGWAVFLPCEGHWKLLDSGGLWPPPDPSSLPGVPVLDEGVEWVWDGASDAYFIPFREAGDTMAALLLGFRQRTSFQPGDLAFAHWKSQLGIALHGLRCTRARVAEALAAAGRMA